MRKRREEPAQLIVRHADTRIDDAKRKFYVVSNNLFILYSKRNASTFGKLRRVVDEVRKDLRKA